MSIADRMTIQGHIGPARSHYCPDCPADEGGRFTPMQATMVMPGRRMVYHCKNGHTVRRGQTLLK